MTKKQIVEYDKIDDKFTINEENLKQSFLRRQDRYRTGINTGIVVATAGLTGITINLMFSDPETSTNISDMAPSIDHVLYYGKKIMSYIGTVLTGIGSYIAVDNKMDLSREREKYIESPKKYLNDLIT